MIMDEPDQKLFRILPSIYEVDEFLQNKKLPFGKAVRKLVTDEMTLLRNQILYGKNIPHFSNRNDVLEYLSTKVKLSQQQSKWVINATGIVIHTNLGRSPLSPEHILSSLQEWTEYSPLEFDLETGQRGKRGNATQALLTTLTGSEDSIIVNNNAAAVLLLLSTFVKGKEIIISRGELVEIGGSFRVPDIMETSGVHLVEVGTTNRTHLYDYENAITENTVGIMKVHYSNFFMTGYTKEVPLTEISTLCKANDLLFFYDWGSGNFHSFSQPSLRSIPTIAQELRAGVDLITFSGDKLLGSIQAGILSGKATLIEQMRQNPLYRALRVDKVTLSILEKSLQDYVIPTNISKKIPTLGMLEMTQEQIQANVESVHQQLSIPQESGWECKMLPITSMVGGGAAPDVSLPSFALALSHPQISASKIQNRLRRASTPVICRVQNEEVWLDFRTIFPKDFPQIVQIIQGLLQKESVLN